MPNFNNNSNNEINNYEKYYFTEENFVHIQQGAGVGNNGQKRQENIKKNNYRESLSSFNFIVKVMNNLLKYKNKNMPWIYKLAKELNKDYILLQKSIKNKYEAKKGKTTKPKKSERKTFSVYPLCALIFYVESATETGQILLPSLYLKEYNSVIKRIKTEWKSAKNKKEVEIHTFMDYMDNELIQKYYKNADYLRRRTISNYLHAKNKNALDINENDWKKIREVAQEMQKVTNRNNNGLTLPEPLFIASVLYVIPNFTQSKFNMDNMRTVTRELNKIKKYYGNKSASAIVTR